MPSTPDKPDPAFRLDKLEHCIEVLEGLLLSDKGLTAAEITEVGRARDLIASTAGTMRNVAEGRQNIHESRRKVKARDQRRKEAKKQKRKQARASRRQNR